MKKKGFTLIELIAVLVILAILALIVMPLVMSIIKKARTAADKRSIDAYGRSIELAIAGYLLDTGTFPTSIGELTVEYNGDEVVCTTTQIKSDSSVYLAGCTVGGRSVEGYTYGKEEAVVYDAYEVGDEVSYNNVDYYVIEDSGKNEDAVTLLKAEPLSYEETQGYGVYVYSNSNYGYSAFSHDSSDYNTSSIKKIVDGWSENNITSGLREARLITLDELVENLSYEYYQNDATSYGYIKSANTPNWIYNSVYCYWTMTGVADSESYIWIINENGTANQEHREGKYSYPINMTCTVRPVIVLSKSVLSK